MEKVIRFAILTSIIPRRVNGTRFHRPPNTLRSIAEEAHKLGMATILLQPNSLSQGGNVTGWVGKKIGSEQENWVLTKLPLPDVAYDNLYVHLVMQGCANKFRKYCKIHRIPFFNPILPNKYVANKISSQIPAISEYIPKTERVFTPANVFQLLHSYPVVYLKPTGGYGGRGVTRITKEKEDQYLVQRDRADDQPSQMNRYMNRPELQRWISQRIAKRVHIVQQGLDLIQVNGGQVDFRVMVQRGKNGKWELIGIVPKISAPGRVVTNLIAGGSKTTLKWIMDWCEKQGEKLPIVEMEKAALQIANYWSGRFPTLGVLGFDMGIDKQGRVWLIEINPKPARSLLYKHMLPKVNLTIAEFAYYLAHKNTALKTIK